MTSNISRRGLLRRALWVGGGVGLPLWCVREWQIYQLETSSRHAQRTGPNDQVTCGVVGLGGRGTMLLDLAANLPGVRLVAVSDVDTKRMQKAMANAGPGCSGYHDFSDLIDQKDVDAIIVATVDHWHSLIATAALRSGLDVYLEKPVGLTIAEGRAVSNAASSHKGIVQTGTQQRSHPNFHLACELVRNGRLGELSVIEARVGVNRQGGPFPVVPIPEELDWERWQGPAPEVPFVKERTHYNFRWWYEYSGGKITDWGAHHNDIAQWALEADDSGPIRVAATGSTPSRQPNSYNMPEQFTVTCTYANGTRLVTTSDGENGNKFVGEKGWIFVSRDRIEASDPKLLEEPLPKDAIRLARSGDHLLNFFSCVRSRKRPASDAEVGHRSATVCHLENISLRLGHELTWDPNSERFTNNYADEANAMLARPMRSPWSLKA